MYYHRAASFEQFFTTAADHDGGGGQTAGRQRKRQAIGSPSCSQALSQTLQPSNYCKSLQISCICCSWPTGSVHTCIALFLSKVYLYRIHAEQSALASSECFTVHNRAPGPMRPAPLHPLQRCANALAARPLAVLVLFTSSPKNEGSNSLPDVIFTSQCLESETVGVFVHHDQDHSHLRICVGPS